MSLSLNAGAQKLVDQCIDEVVELIGKDDGKALSVAIFRAQSSLLKSSTLVEIGEEQFTACKFSSRFNDIARELLAKGDGVVKAVGLRMNLTGCQLCPAAEIVIHTNKPGWFTRLHTAKLVYA